MFLFGLEGSGFIITLGLILLMSGVIMYYCLRRFAMLESSMIDQGRILHSFINKITPGLYNLKKTYSDNKKIKALIDSVIMALLDFKNETQIKKHTSLSSILREHNNNIFLIP